MKYAARLDPAEEGGFVVTFRDIPEAITQGDHLEEALAMAADALATAMEFYLEDRRPAPVPTPAAAGEYLVRLAPDVAHQIARLNAELAQ